MTRHLLILILNFSFLSADKMASQEFTSGNNIFNGDIYKKISKKAEENFLVCPFSAEVVLALIQNGAKNETAQEIKTGLHLPNDIKHMNSAIKTLLASLKNDNCSWHAANKIYVRPNFPVKKEFNTIASQVYAAQVENINFSSPSEAATVINEWVKKQTENKIQNLVDPQNLDPDSKIILVNVLYFKGDWINPFEASLTETADFYKTTKDVIKVDMMGKTSYYNYYESKELKATFLDMPFKCNYISMIIALPDAQEGLADLENQIDKVFSPHKFGMEHLSVYLPKFKIETQVDFKEVLEELGIKKAFKKDADFSGMTGAKGILHVNNVIQKTFLQVNEEGVEAAAATEIEMLEGGSMFRPKAFTANHPFIFYIKINDVIIFVGRVKCPNS